MTAAQFVLGAVRLALIVGPLLVTAHGLRRHFLETLPVALAGLVELVLAIGLLVVGAEALGLLSLLRAWSLAALFVVTALLVKLLLRTGPGSGSTATGGPPAPTAARGASRSKVPAATRWTSLVAVIVVAAQWLLATANALGSGMANFDTLWYHMPFAARFAQTGSVSAIHFTQADPITAYYPANSELIHAVGIAALHGDVLSPALNLMWLGIALLACWCTGLPWRAEVQTLTGGCLVLGLPVLAATQPGEAFNDVAGLAMLLAGIALIVNADAQRSRRRDHKVLMAAGGLALGFAAGTKYTFLVPALVLWLAVIARGPSGGRVRMAGVMAGAIVLTGGWWYLRNLIDVGNPVGLGFHLGPLALPGPSSPIATSLQQTVLSQVEHTSLWGSRFAPGLAHAIGPLWPLLIGGCIAAVIVGIGAGRRWPVRALAITTCAATAAYLVFPTGATALQQGTSLFEVNLRYATPALAIAVLLVTLVVRERAPGWASFLAPAFLVILLAAQFEPQLWPTQAARHALFLIVTGLVVATAPMFVTAARQARGPRMRRGLTAVAAGAALGLSAVAAYGVQHHYYARRYLDGAGGLAGAGGVYRWAQRVAHSRIALYGFLTQYPLYGARDTNRVDYLGQHTGGGGYRPLPDCQDWRATIARGAYDYLVISPGPTGTVPVSWTQSDPAASVVLHPSPRTRVFRLSGAMSPKLCGG